MDISRIHTLRPQNPEFVPVPLPQLCIQNLGRPAAAALADLVRGAAEAFAAGYPLDRLRLELEFAGNGGEGAVDAAGYRLMESDKRYRQQWLDTVGGSKGLTHQELSLRQGRGCGGECRVEAKGCIIYHR